MVDEYHVLYGFKNPLRIAISNNLIQEKIIKLDNSLFYEHKLLEYSLVSKEIFVKGWKVFISMAPREQDRKIEESYIFIYNRKIDMKPNENRFNSQVIEPQNYNEDSCFVKWIPNYFWNYQMHWVCYNNSASYSHRR